MSKTLNLGQGPELKDPSKKSRMDYELWDGLITIRIMISTISSGHRKNRVQHPEKCILTVRGRLGGGGSLSSQSANVFS